MNKLLNAALGYADKGWHVFPVKPDTKVPLTAHGHTAATTDRVLIKNWWHREPNANIGIAMEASGLVAVDVDAYKGVDEWADAAKEISTGETYTQNTANGGKHYVYQAKDGDRYAATVCKNVDIRYRGYILGAPSVVGGKSYTVLVNTAPVMRSEALLRPVVDERRSGEFMVTQSTVVQQEEAEGVLSHCPAVDYAEWVEGLMAIKAAYSHDPGQGLELALAWSAGEYGNEVQGYMGPDSVESKWDTLQATGGITWGTMVYRARENGYGQKPTSVKLPEPTVDGTDRWTTALRSGADRTFSLDQEYLIKGYLMKGALSVMYGPPNCGKSFLALSMSSSIQNGTPWLGNRVKQGQTVYIAAEGGGGIVDRLEALDREGVDVSNMLYIPEGPDMSEDAADLAKALTGLHPSLIIIDTLARTMGGLDESSNTDMNRFVRGCDLLRETTGAHVLIVHHCGKDASKGARGASSLLGAVDTEIRIAESEGNRSITVTKQRDIGFMGRSFFELKPVLLGQDQDGEDVGSCVVAVAEEPVAVAGDNADPEHKDTILSTIRRLIAESGGDVITQQDLRYALQDMREYEERTDKGMKSFLVRQLGYAQAQGDITLTKEDRKGTYIRLT